MSRRKRMVTMKKFMFIFFLVIISNLITSFVRAEQTQLNHKSIVVVFRNDDICALSDFEHEEKIFELFERYQIPQTIGIIPNAVEDFHDVRHSKYHILTQNPKIMELLKEYHKKGLIEIALHGYSHQTNFLHPTKKEIQKKASSGPGGIKWLPYAPINNEGYSEFRGLPYEEQLQKIMRGKRLLEDQFDVSVSTFIPPWNSYDEATAYAIFKDGFQLISSEFKSYNKFSQEIQDKLLFIEADTGISNLKAALESAHQFVREKKLPVLITVLYHSWMLNSQRDLENLEDLLKIIAQSQDISTMTLREVSELFREPLKKIFPVAKEARPKIQDANALLSLVRYSSPLKLERGFDVMNAGYYQKEKNLAERICYKFYSSSIILAMLIGVIFLWLTKFGILNRQITIFLILFGITVLTSYLIVSYFGLIGLMAGIGARDLAVMFFTAGLTISFILGNRLIKR